MVWSTHTHTLTVDTSSAEYTPNAARMQEQVDELRAQMQEMEVSSFGGDGLML